MNKALLILLCFASSVNAQVDCNDLPENYTGTCSTHFHNGYTEKEYTLEEGKVVSGKEYNIIGELDRTFEIEDEQKLTFSESRYFNGKTKISNVTLTNGNGFFNAVYISGHQHLLGELKKGYPVGVWKGFDTFQNKRVEVHFGPAPKGRPTYDELQENLRELIKKMEQCIWLAKNEDTVIVLNERMRGEQPPEYISCNEIGENFTGICESFYVDGKIERRQQYNNGSLICDTRFNRQGDTSSYLHASGKYDLTVTVKKYYSNNQLLSKFSTRDGTGLYMSYHPNGKLEAEGVMVDSACTGKWFYYDTSGTFVVQLIDKGVNRKKCHSGAQLQRVVKETVYYMQQAHKYALDAEKPLPFIIDDRDALMQEARAFYAKQSPPPVPRKPRTQKEPVAVTPNMAVPVPPPAPEIREEVVVAAEILEFPDKEAEFPGGQEAMMKFIAENIVYPQEAIDLGIQGKVYLSFVIEIDGRPTNIKVERGVERSLDREAKRVVRIMPNWTPGEVRGKKVRTRVRLPVYFQLTGEKEN